jgi:phage FluMu protein Com
MAGEMIRFRCYQCGRLLGAPASKVGRTTSCPKCKAELIIPDPEAEPDIGDAIRSLTPAIDISQTPQTPESTRAESHDPGFSWEEIDTAIFQSAAAANERLDLQFPITEPAIEPPPLPLPPISTVSEIVEVDLAQVDPEVPGMPEIQVDVAPVTVDRSAPRRNPGDVVLSQSILVSFSVFVILALGISFLAGLFTGHYFWKS